MSERALIHESEAALDLSDALEYFAKTLHDFSPGDYWQKRVTVARLTGSLDAKHMVYMLQTHGYPLWAYVDEAVRKEPSIRIPWSMLEHELICIGKNKDSIASLFAEMRFGLRKGGRCE